MRIVIDDNCLNRQGVNGDAIVAPLTHENTEPKFNHPT